MVYDYGLVSDDKVSRVMGSLLKGVEYQHRYWQVGGMHLYTFPRGQIIASRRLGERYFRTAVYTPEGELRLVYDGQSPAAACEALKAN